LPSEQFEFETPALNPGNHVKFVDDISGTYQGQRAHARGLGLKLDILQKLYHLRKGD